MRSPSTWRPWWAGWATASSTGSRTTSRGSRPGSATAGACTPRVARASATRSRPRITCCSRTAAPWRSCAATRPAREVGISPRRLPGLPGVDDEPPTSAAARHFDGFHNRWFLDPLFRGAYPADLLEHFGANAPVVESGDFGLDRRLTRLHRASTTTGARSCARSENGDARTVAHAATRITRTWAGRSRLKGCTTCSSPQGRLRAASHLRDRERRRLWRPSAHDGSVRGPGAPRLPGGPHRRDRARGRRRRADRRLLRLVVPRQLRVGRTATASASGSSTSTTRPWPGFRSRASTGTAISSRVPPRRRSSRRAHLTARGRSAAGQNRRHVRS